MGPLELQVTVETGDRRGAGTVAAVDITLVGTTGAVGERVGQGRGRAGRGWEAGAQASPTGPVRSLQGT